MSIIDSESKVIWVCGSLVILSPADELFLFLPGAAVTFKLPEKVNVLNNLSVSSIIANLIFWLQVHGIHFLQNSFLYQLVLKLHLSHHDHIGP